MTNEIFNRCRIHGVKVMVVQIAVLFLHSAFCLLPFHLVAATNDLSPLLQQGLFEEEGNRDLNAAIADYQSLANQFDQNRQMAATAIFRLGECYRKLNQTNEAVVQYQRIVREFPDQQTLAALSRQNLTGLGSAPTAAEPESGADGSKARAAAAAEAEAASIGAELDQLLKLNRAQLRTVIPQNYPNPVLTKLLQDRSAAEQKLVLLSKDFTPAHPAYKSAKELKDTIDRQIDNQIDAVLKGLEAKRNAAMESAKALRAIPAGAPAAGQNAQAAPADDAEAQELRRLQTMLQNSPDLINSRPINGMSPLASAASQGWLRVAAFLLEHGANVNSETDYPLSIAADNGNRAMVEFLLSHGAKVNAKSWQERTALHMAAEKGYQAVAEVLVANQADLEARDKNGDTPLHRAAANHRTPLLQLLVAKGANVNVENKNGRTPLSYAASGSSDEAGILLVAHADPNSGASDAPLLVAINGHNVDSARMLLENGADPNAKSRLHGPVEIDTTYFDFTSSPLLLAVLQQQLPMAQLLLKSGADPNNSHIDGRPLISERTLWDTNILESLLDAGARPNVRSSSNRDPDIVAPLEQAIMDNRAGAVEILLRHGADAKAPGLRGVTPLHLAATAPVDRKIFELLLNAGADPNVRDDGGFTPLDRIKQQQETLNTSPERKTALGTLAEWLRAHGALDQLPNWDRIAVSRPSANFVFTIFRKGTNDWNRFTLLETILNYYESSAMYSVSQGNNTWSNYRASSMMPFPDLTHVTVVRPRHDSTNEMRMTVNLLNDTNGIDCSKDLPLEFGDVVEIPERDHSLDDRMGGLYDEQRGAIGRYLKGNIQLIVHHQKAELPINPLGNDSTVSTVLNYPEAQKLLLYSSDLSRVKVTRRDPKTGKKNEWILDCRRRPSSPGPFITLPGPSSNENSALSTELRLRDGDVIEVPEK